MYWIIKNITKYFSTSKLDPTSPCYSKLMNTKKFNPARSSVLEVLNAHEKGHFEVDVRNIHEVGISNNL